jgi:8-hydroxy-5-deazaflavin:NADPH oxidoreductase
MEAKKIGIIGSAIVAQALAKGFVKYGYSVMMGSRDQSKLQEWRSKSNVDVLTGSFEDAAKYGDIIVLAVKGTVAVDVIKGIKNHIKGKTVIDTTNPIAEAPPQNGVLKFFTDINKSLMEELQQLAPDANFVKAFSSVGNALMVDPKTKEKPSMFICGNSEASRKEVSKILDTFGWETEDMGKAEAARAIEPLCILWCIPGFLSNQWSHAFKLLRA